MERAVSRSPSAERNVNPAHAGGDDLVADLHGVPGQRNDVFDLLFEDEDEDAAAPSRRVSSWVCTTRSPARS